MTWTAERIFELGTAYWKSCVLSAAVEIGLFEAIGEGATAEQVAGLTKSSARHAGELMNALASLGVLEKGGDVYRISPSAAHFLKRSSPTCLLDALRYNIDLYQLWGKLGACVKGGRPVIPPSAHLGEDPSRTRRFVLGMHSKALLEAPMLLPALDPGKRSNVLDVGSGPGTFSCMLAEKRTDLKLTLFDLPPILGVARELIKASSVEGRVSFHPGDYHRDPLPRGFDAVFFCGALHQETPDSARRIFGEIHKALNPGGEVSVADMMVTSDRTQPTFSILFSLNMMLTSSGGQVFTEDETKSELAKAGFAKIRCMKPSGCPYWVVKGEKR